MNAFCDALVWLCKGMEPSATDREAEAGVYATKNGSATKNRSCQDENN